MIRSQIIHGDCIEELKKIPNESVDCIITDPPYGVLEKGKAISKAYRKPTNLDCEWDMFENFEEFTKQWFDLSFSKLKNNSFMYVFWSQKKIKMGYEIFNPARMVFWRYNNLTLGGNGDFAYDYEPIFVIKKGNPKLSPGKHSCDLEFTKPQSKFKKDRLIHPTQKPLALCEHLIKISTSEDALILDPFGGSGTTYVAALNMKRESIVIEKSEEYYNLILTRAALLHK